MYQEQVKQEIAEMLANAREQKRQVTQIIKGLECPYILKIVDFKPTLFLNFEDIEKVKDNYFKNHIFTLKKETSKRYYYDSEMIILYPTSV